MKNVVDISCFPSGKWLEMRVFNGLRGGVRLAGQTVDGYKYGLKNANIWVSCTTLSDSDVKLKYIFSE